MAMGSVRPREEVRLVGPITAGVKQMAESPPFLFGIAGTLAISRTCNSFVAPFSIDSSSARRLRLCSHVDREMAAIEDA